ncbi:hypothetical protein [Mariprofundus ferrooxydans]|uniref:Uncharacterized protein n=1 Tax=Mariprofundus ferrooxydans PV-1 TaxID=314345 RepID=Q0EWQ1_9PROT|nr:hypothetical protein [Mariprofundus ferrooxydans]EAU53738.1 hypothetical protein SPV1_06349 [Mariprofundus ferrooxydans PV-1]
MSKKKSLIKLIRQKPIGSIDTAIGKVFLFPDVSVSDLTGISEDLADGIENIESEAYVRVLFRYLCHRENSLDNDKSKPNKPTLTKSDIDMLSVEELEEIASVYLKHNERLYKKEETDAETGMRVFGNVEHPKEDNESNVSYLYRLSVIDHEKRNKQIEAIWKKFSGASNFSSKLTETLSETLHMGDSLKASVERIRRASQLPKIAVQPKDLSNELILRQQELYQLEEEKRAKPFKDLAERLDLLIDTSTQSAEFMAEANSNQVQIANEIKSSGDSASKFSKWSIFFTVVVISLSIYTIWSDIQAGNIQQELLKKYSEEISEKLVGINSGLSRRESQAAKEIELLGKSIDYSAMTQSETVALINHQRDEISNLTKSNAALEKIIKQLEERLKALEKQKESK